MTVTGSGATRTQLAAAFAEMEKRDGQFRIVSTMALQLSTTATSPVTWALTTLHPASSH